jgi:hypothetical protein
MPKEGARIGRQNTPKYGILKLKTKNIKMS